jgi:hypothetical protein
MVWIIPRDTDENMIKQLVCLMTNIESNRHIFDENSRLIEEGNPLAGRPFNVHEDNSVCDEFRFVKGYVRCTGLVISNSVIEERMSSMNKFMPKDISLDLSYGYPTAHYTVARVQITKEYSRLVAYHNQKLKGIKHKHHFIWMNEPFGLNDFQELRVSKTKTVPETYELMRSLSTIIFDNGGIFASDHYGQNLVPGKLVQHINYPEIWQVRGSDRIVNLPVIISEKFGIRPNIAKKFAHLIPATKKFTTNKNYLVDKLYYREGVGANGFDVIEEKTIGELNLAEFDKKESIFKKILDSKSAYNLMRLNITSANVNQLTLDMILNYLACHICRTPLYDKFYYAHAPHPDNALVPHIPICALCMHNNSGSKLGKLNVGISKSPFSASEVTGMIPKPINVKYENYEKYKQLMSILLNTTIEIDKENPSGILYESEEAILVSQLSISVLAASFNKPNACIFIVDFMV